MSRPDFDTLIESLKEHQLKGSIIKCRLEWLPDKPIKIINGHKRDFLCRKFSIPITEEILVAKTEADYLKYLKQFKEPWLTTKSKKAWVNVYAESLYTAGIKPGQIAETVAMLSGTPVRTVRRWLYNRYKDRSQRRRALGGQSGRRGSKSRKPLPLKFRKDFNFLSRESLFLAKTLYNRAGEEFIRLCYLIREHFDRMYGIEGYTTH